MAPWGDGPRHRSWASNTVISTAAFAIIFATYVIWEIEATAPAGITTLLGIAGGAWFSALGDDTRRRREDKHAERTRQPDPDSGGYR